MARRQSFKELQYTMEEEELDGIKGDYFHPVTGELLDVKRVFVYKTLPTLRKFHACPEFIRAVVGPVGSGKTAGVSVEIGYRIPMMLWNRYRVNKTRGVILRNTYPMLIDSTQKSFFEWFPPGLYGTYNKNEKTYLLSYTTLDERDEPCTLDIEILFRSCDRPEEVDQFRGYELTWYYIDEADEVHRDIKAMLKQRVGRFPPMRVWYPKLKRRYPHLRGLSNEEIQKEIIEKPEFYQLAFGIESSNPPSTEADLYSTFEWKTHVPGPKSERKPLAHHAGFWQPPRENEINLRPGYYAALAEAYAYAKDWVDRYIEGEPGVRLKGKQVYANFVRALHEARAKLIWSGGLLYRGWDNTGLHPACVIVQSPTPRQFQVLREHWTPRENIVTFAKRVIAMCNQEFPNAEWLDFADPAGWQQFSRANGTLTSNSQLMMEECDGLALEPSEQNFKARVNSVDELMAELVAGGEPALLIDPDCVGILNGFLGGYFYPRISSSTAGEELYSENVVKNKYADLHDALQYVVVRLRRSRKMIGRSGGNKFGRPADPLLIS